MLKSIPSNINRLITDEQHRMDLHDRKKLKKHAIVYCMLSEWYSQKAVIIQLHKANDKKDSLIIEQQKENDKKDILIIEKDSIIIELQKEINLLKSKII